MSRFRFVADHRHAYGVKRLCEVLQIARSSFYAWLDGQPRRAQRAAADAELAERIRVVHQRDTTQGAPRITAELNDGAPPVARVNHKRVARVMREHGIAGLRLRRRVRTTVPEPADQKVPDLLDRDFTADAANQRYVGDITYLPLADGSNLYLATVIDCFSRRLAGWAIAEHMRTELIADALTAARDTQGLAGRSDLPLRPRRAVHLEGLRPALREPGSDSVDGRGRRLPLNRLIVSVSPGQRHAVKWWLRRDRGHGWYICSRDQRVGSAA